MDETTETPVEGLREGEEAETRESIDPTIEARQRRAESLKGTLEHRSLGLEPIEVRELDDGTIRMGGYGSVTEVWYPVGAFQERVRRSAFRRTLGEDPHVVLLYGHDGMPYASTRNATLSLNEDSRGLHWTADLDGQDPDSRVLARKVEQGLITECSFAFQVTDQEWDESYSERTIKSVSLHRGDVSLVVAGANPETSVSLRSDDLMGALEQRAGKALSAATKAELQSAVDKITALLNPETEAEPDVVVEPEPRKVTHVPDHTSIARAEFDLLVARSAT